MSSINTGASQAPGTAWMTDAAEAASVTGANWEGTGGTLDITVSADQALDTAVAETGDG